MADHIFAQSTNNIESDILSQMKFASISSRTTPMEINKSSNFLKPKGLTIRSGTQFNTNETKSPYKKTLDVKSPYKLNSRPLSPFRRLLLQKQAARFKRKKELFLAKIKETQKLASQNTFGIPQSIEFPEPEQLAHEDDSIWDDNYLDSPLENLSVQEEDEGFISESEMIYLDVDDLRFNLLKRRDNFADDDIDIMPEVKSAELDLSYFSDLDES